jgi:hypothetical protein
MAVVDFGMDWSPLATLGEKYQQAQQRQQLQEGLQRMGLPGNLNLAQLAMQQQEHQRAQSNTDRSFGLQERQVGIGEARDTRDFGFRQQEAQRAQTNVDRSHEFQRMQAEAAARGFEIKELDDGMGGKRLVRVERATGKATALPVDGDTTGGQPQNPFATGKLNEQQSKDALFASRMLGAEKILRNVEPAVATDRIQKGLGTVSDKIGYDLRSPAYTKFDQAKRDFINAVLRKESGAVISDSEFKNAEQQYFPQPGQGADIIEQKRQARAEAIRGIAAGAGPGYRPDFTFDEKGEIVANPAPKRGDPKPQQSFNWKTRETIMGARQNAEATIAQAKEAIAKGMPPAEAMKRLQAAGIPVDPATFGGAPAAPNPANFGFGN